MSLPSCVFTLHWPHDHLLNSRFQLRNMMLRTPSTASEFSSWTPTCINRETQTEHLIQISTLIAGPIFRARKRSCGKVMFSQAFVCPHGGVWPTSPGRHRHPSRQIPSTPPPKAENPSPPPPEMATKAGGTHPTGMPPCYHNYLAI